MKPFLFGIALGALAMFTGLSCQEPEPAMCVQENMTCSAAKVAASRVCDCQIVCYEDSR